MLNDRFQTYRHFLIDQLVAQIEGDDISDNCRKVLNISYPFFDNKLVELINDQLSN